MKRFPFFPDASRRATLSIAAGTLLMAGTMNAMIGHWTSELDETRQKQIEVATVDQSTTAALDLPSRSRRDDRQNAERAMSQLVAGEDRSTLTGLSEAFDQSLARIDREIADLGQNDSSAARKESEAAQAVQKRLQTELANFGRLLQARAEKARLATEVSSLVDLLLCVTLVAFFADRYRRRTDSLAALAVQSHSAQARELRFKLLLEIEEATRDLNAPQEALRRAAESIRQSFDAVEGAFERVDRFGHRLEKAVPGFPDLTSDDLASLCVGRSKTEGELLRSPILLGGHLRAVVTLRKRADGWRHDEIALVEEAVARCGAYLERAEADAAVRSGEEHHRFVIDASNDGVWERDVATDAIVWSERMFHMLGLSPESFFPTYASHCGLVHPDDLQTFVEAMRDQLADDRPFSLNLRFRRANGQFLSVLTQGRTQRDAEGRPIRTVGTLTDLTNVLEAERAKQVVERQSRWTTTLLEAQLDSSPDGIIAVDADNVRILQNRRMAEVWGLPTDVIDDVDDDRQFEMVMERVKDREAFSAIFKQILPHELFRDVVELKDGTVLDRRSAPATGPDGIHYGRIWTFRDITDRIRNEQDLEARVESRTRDLAAATEAAERANAAKSEFLSRMSHELRTPLNAILGFGQILQRQVEGEIQKESVHYILKGGRHLLGLINEVLDLSRVESGHAELSIEPVPLAEIVDESLAMVRTAAAERGLRLDEGMGGIDGLHVVADRQRLKQVLINLLSNAVKYNRPGGHVAVRFREYDGWLQIAVEDSGYGIPEEGLAKLFTPFERLGAAAGVEGTGLGLFLTQRLVGAMGGRLSVESAIGEGSTFTVELELARAPAEEFSKHVALSLPSMESSREVSVLCIEDNSSNLRLMEMLFAHRPNVRLISASEGLTGFRLARETPPDLILLDLNLPDVSGSEVLARLKRSGTTSAIPVIMISADALPERAEENLRAGAAAFLTKPLNIEGFLDTFDQTLTIPKISKSEPLLQAA